MNHHLLSKGIYAIINKKLNMVYVGKTERNFLIRWIEHLIRIPDYVEDPKRIHLYLNQSTKFIILKTMDDREFTRGDFYRFESEAQDFYVKMDWGILSSRGFNSNYNFSQLDFTESVLERYRKAVNHITYILARVNTKHTNGSVILSNLYTKVNKHFNTDIQSRKGKSSLQKLTKEELEFVLLELYPRYYHKRLDILRDEYKHIKFPESLFDYKS